MHTKGQARSASSAHKRFHVIAINDNVAFADFCGGYDSYEGAHYEAFGIYEQTGVYTEVLRGDEVMWDSRNGYHCA